VNLRESRSAQIGPKEQIVVFLGDIRVPPEAFFDDVYARLESVTAELGAVAAVFQPSLAYARIDPAILVGRFLGAGASLAGTDHLRSQMAFIVPGERLADPALVILALEVRLMDQAQVATISALGHDGVHKA
jgi:hypothetical protein